MVAQPCRNCSFLLPWAIGGKEPPEPLSLGDLVDLVDLLADRPAFCLSARSWAMSLAGSSEISSGAPCVNDTRDETRQDSIVILLPVTHVYVLAWCMHAILAPAPGK